MNSGTEMYKKKYLKYKMKYLSLEGGGSAIKKLFTTSTLDDDEKEEICVYHQFKIKSDCKEKYKDTLDKNFPGYFNGCATHPHNYYLEIMSENGIIGLLLFIFIIYIFFKIFINIFIKNIKIFIQIN